MKAVLLIGGLATRLYPLSKQLAKPLLPVCDREVLHYQVEQLVRADVREIVLAAGHHAEQIAAFTEHYSGGVRFHLSLEDEPLGTAGAIAHAREYLGDEPAVVLNADVLCSLDMTKFIATHRRLGRMASICGYAMDDPSRYGLLEVEDQLVMGFREKPTGDPGRGPHYINTGAYVLEPEAIAAIPDGRSVSIERETFPKLIAEHGGLGFHSFSGFWADIGTFESYFAANFALLAQRFALGPTPLWGDRHDCAVFKDLVYLHKQARLGKQLDLYHRVIVMANAEVGDGCRLQNCLLMPGARVGASAQLEDCIVGPKGEVPEGAHAGQLAFIAGEEPVPFYPHATEAR